MLKGGERCVLVAVMVLTLGAVFAAGATPSGDLKITEKNYTLDFTGLQATILINGKAALQIGGIGVYNDNTSLNFTPASISKLSPNTIQVAYKNYGKARLTSTYTLSANQIWVQCYLHDMNGTFSDNYMDMYFQCNPVNDTTRRDDCIKGAHWKHCNNTNRSNCEPYEVKEGYFREFRNPNKTILLKIPENSHLDWGVGGYEHVGFQNIISGQPAGQQRISRGSHSGWGTGGYGHTGFQGATAEQPTRQVYSSKIGIFILPETLQDLSDDAASAATEERVAVLKLSTGNDYNIFKPADGSPVFKASVTNIRSQGLSGKLTVVAHNLDGKLTVLDNDSGVATTNVPVSINGYSTYEHEFKLPVAQHERELYFVEASLKINGDTSGNDYFTRTNIAILPDVKFNYKNKSVFGTSDYFQLPSEHAALTLMDRLGVHYLRDGNNTEIKRVAPSVNIHAFAQSGVNFGGNMTASLEAALDQIKSRKNDVWELGNELNPLCDRSESDCQEQIETAINDYTEWAKNAYSMRNDMGLQKSLALITMGIAGQDLDFLDGLKAKGSYDWFDGIAFHPGRANYTADFYPDVDAPAEDDPGHDASWTCYGTVRGYRDYVGSKPLYATEVYAGTLPNNFYRDSYRQAAGNIILTLSLGLAEGLLAIEAYQFNDTTWYDEGGVPAQDSEDADQYHYGLLMRDLSLKPSAMAYAATAEVLDGAKPSGTLIRRGSLRALSFDTPDKRKVAVLWDRSEGYIQAVDQAGFCHMEPWLSTYGKKVRYRFKIAGKDIPAVQVVDMIGRKYNRPTDGGYVDLELSGEPMFVYDVDVEHTPATASIFLPLLE